MTDIYTELRSVILVVILENLTIMLLITNSDAITSRWKDT